MKLTIKSVAILIFVLFILLSISCNYQSKTNTNDIENTKKLKKSNPVVYFEIPVNDMNRAMFFYKNVFNFDFTQEIVDSNNMAFFPFESENTGISGALAKGAIYKPTNDGVLIYFTTENIDKTLKLAVLKGGKILYHKTNNGIGFVAEFEDTEGNRIALYQAN